MKSGNTAAESGHPVIHRFALDLVLFAALGFVAVGVGLLMNAVRRDPLPWRYASPRERVQSAAAMLSTGDAAGMPVEQIGLDAFQQLAAGRSALILDARPDIFYHNGHVPGAFNLAREAFARDYARLRTRLEADKRRRIVVYCADPDCPDSALVASALSRLGFKHVADFHGGWGRLVGRGAA